MAPANSSNAVVNQVPLAGHAILVFTGVLTHWSHEYAISHFEASNGDRFEQLGHGFILFNISLNQQLVALTHDRKPETPFACSRC